MSAALFRAITIALTCALLPAAKARADCDASKVINPMPAERPSSSTRMVVLDISPSTEQRTVVNRIFSLSGNDGNADIRELRRRLLTMLECFPDSTSDVSSAASPVIDWLDEHAESLAALSSLRWTGTRGDRIEVYLLRSPGRKGKVDVKEEIRSTRLASDFVTLAELAQKILVSVNIVGPPPPPPPHPPYSFTYREFLLAKPRATVKLVGTLVPYKSADASQPDSLKLSLITGPPEHFFLSANVANTQAHQFKYDETSRSIQPVSQPKEFFVGIDYTIGDILDDSKQSGFLDGVYFGLMLEGSSRPFNQLGVSLGFRHNPIGDWVTFDAVSPYVALDWARSDRLSGSAASPAIDSKYGKGKVVFGLSLNLEKALGWVGK